MRFNINGQGYEITKEDVVGSADGTVPERPDRRHRYFVGLGDCKYPIKQLLANVTGLGHAEFTAQYAYRILSRLGFRVEEFRPTRPRVQPSPSVGSIQINDSSNATQGSFRFAVTLEQDEDGFFVSSCPALQGCHSQGRTGEEALNNISEAIRGYLASMRKHGETIPDERWEVVEVRL